MLEIYLSYILHKKEEFYAIKGDAKNKPKLKLNNSYNPDCYITSTSTWKTGKKEKKTRKTFEKQIANEELKKRSSDTQNLVKKFNLKNKLNKSSVHKTFNT